MVMDLEEHNILTNKVSMKTNYQNRHNYFFTMALFHSNSVSMDVQQTYCYTLMGIEMHVIISYLDRNAIVFLRMYVRTTKVTPAFTKWYQ